MKKFLRYSIILLIVTGQLLAFAAAQDNPPLLERRCATMDWLETQLKDQAFRAQYEENQRRIEAIAIQKIREMQSNPNRTEAITYIPIVFHVVLTAAQQASYPDNLVYRQLDSLNKDFAGLNSDSANVPAAFQAVRGHSIYQFCLAQQTPTGGATNGIVRVSSTTLSNSSQVNDPIKSTAAGGSDAWDPTRYVNVWLCNFTNPSLLGYATFPIGSPENPGGPLNQQGVTTLAQSVPGGTAAPFNRGRTLTHELGHFFWLRHITGDSPCGNDFPTTPGLDDTPQQNNLTGGCPGSAPNVNTVASGCASAPNPPGRMFQNYMDYTDDACMTMFTNGQNARSELCVSMFRASLLTSNGCLAPFGFGFNNPAPVVSACPAGASMANTLGTISTGGFSNPISLSATGNPGGTTVSFSPNPVVPGGSTTVTLTGTNTLAPGNYVITVTGTATGAPNQTRDLTFTISPGSGPTVTTQPSSQTVCAGDNVTFTVAAASATYQWQVSTNGGGSWTNIGGATATSYTINGVTAGLSGNQYRCVLSGQCGTTNSSAATLTVNVGPAVTAQPQNQSVCAASAASFSVTATGGGLSYQWEESTDGGATWNPVGGATSATYNIASTTTAMNGYRYRCVVTGACPPAVTSNAAILTVSSSITITGNPANATVCEGTNTSFTAAASGSGLNYQWEVSTDGGTSWNNVSNGGVYSGATTQTLNLTGVMPSMNNYRYRCVVSNPPCNPGTTTAALLTVNTFPVITAQPQSATICEGAGNTFSVTATTGVGVLTYQWQVSTNGGTSYSNITGATSSTLPLNLITAGANGYRYRVIVTAGCGSVTSNAAILTVNTYPVITLGAVPAVVCVSDPALTLTGSPAGGAFSGTGISGNVFSPAAAGVGSATVTYTATNAGCVSTANRVILVNECPERHLRLGQYPAIIVYPNPNNGHVNIRLNTDLYTRLGVKAYNSAGQMVQNNLFNGLAYGSVVSLDLSRQAAGTYHLFIYNDENGGVDKHGVSIVIYK